MLNYAKEEKILDKLEELKEMKKMEVEYNPIERGVEGLLKGCLENKKEIISDEMLDTFEKLNEKFTTNQLLSFFIEINKSLKPFLADTDKTVKSMKKNQEEVKDEIGKIMLDDAALTGITERSHHFKNFGDVKCSTKITPVIIDIDKVKTVLCQNTDYFKYLKIDEPKLKKDKNVQTIDGIELQDKITVTIRSDSKWV